MLQHLGVPSVAPGPLDKVLQDGATAWKALLDLSKRNGPLAAAEPRKEAARKLIANHEAVLRDLTNPSADKNIVGKPLTQLELQRVPVAQAQHADEALREVARRLLKEEAEQPETWAQMATYLDGRIQGAAEEKPGRTPDMSEAAAAAMRAVLAEVGNTGRSPAGRHAYAVRFEAARKLIDNFDNVLKDVTNPNPTENIEGKPLTQLELHRVLCITHGEADGKWRAVAQGLREVARRLLEPALDQPAMAATWAQATTYLIGRIQATPEQKPGRAPDMSAAAAAAMRAVLREVGRLPSTTGSTPMNSPPGSFRKQRRQVQTAEAGPNSPAAEGVLSTKLSPEAPPGLSAQLSPTPPPGRPSSGPSARASPRASPRASHRTIAAAKYGERAE